MATAQEIASCARQWMATREDAFAAEAFALDSLAKCRDAIQILQNRLVESNYPVRDFITPISTTQLESVTRKLARHTQQPIPKILIHFWSIIGGVSFLDLTGYSHETYWRKNGIEGKHHFCDGFHIDTCDQQWVEYISQEYDDLAYDDEQELFQYALAPDGYHKADISGGGPYGVSCKHSWFPTWQAFWWSGYDTPPSAQGFNVMNDVSMSCEDKRVPDELDFLSYVRTTILECGGFPGLYGSPGFEPIRKSLTVDLPAF